MYVLVSVPFAIGLLGLSVTFRTRVIYAIGLAGAMITLMVNTQRATIVLFTVTLPLVFLLARKLRAIRNGLIALCVLGAGGVGWSPDSRWGVRRASGEHLDGRPSHTDHWSDLTDGDRTAESSDRRGTRNSLAWRGASFCATRALFITVWRPSSRSTENSYGIRRD